MESGRQVGVSSLDPLVVRAAAYASTINQIITIYLNKMMPMTLRVCALPYLPREMSLARETVLCVCVAIKSPDTRQRRVRSSPRDTLGAVPTTQHCRGSH